MKVHSIFTSIDGEVNAQGQGTPSVFIRMQGCNLGCPYCDAPDAQEQKDDNLTVDQVMASIWAKINPIGFNPPPYPKITITGGEPLLQQDEIHQLLNRLFPHNFKVSIETNGTIALNRFRNLTRPNPGVCLVVDYKLHMLPVLLPAVDFSALCPWDWIKFVISNRLDYDMAKEIVLNMGTRARIAFSPVHESLPGNTLAQWILADRLWQVTLNCQIHKFLSLA